MIRPFITARQSIDLLESLKEQLFEQLHPFEHDGTPRKVTVTPAMQSALELIASIRGVPYAEALSGYLPIRRISTSYAPESIEKVAGGAYAECR